MSTPVKRNCGTALLYRIEDRLRHIEVVEDKVCHRQTPLLFLLRLAPLNPPSQPLRWQRLGAKQGGRHEQVADFREADGTFLMERERATPVSLSPTAPLRENDSADAAAWRWRRRRWHNTDAIPLRDEQRRTESLRK